MITVYFSYEECGVEKVKAFVRDRKDREDVTKWYKEMQECVALHHSIMSPHCRAKQIKEVAIPIYDAVRGIGYPTSS